MCGNLICVAAIVLGVDAGWREMPDGDGTQYLIQIEPHLLESLKAGEPIESDIRPGIGNVRGFRITVGQEILEKTVPAAASQARPAEKALDAWPSDGSPPPMLAPPMLERPPVSEPPEPEPSAAANPWPASPFGAGPASTEPMTPAPIAPDPTSRPLPAEQAVYVEPGKPPAAAQGKVAEPKAAAPQTPEPKIASNDDSKTKDSSRPWVLTIMALLVSVGANFYLLWIVKSFRGRYRSLLSQTAQA